MDFKTRRNKPCDPGRSNLLRLAVVSFSAMIALRHNNDGSCSENPVTKRKPGNIYHGWKQMLSIVTLLENFIVWKWRGSSAQRQDQGEGGAFAEFARHGEISAEEFGILFGDV